MRFDPIKLELYRNILNSIAEEMGVALCRSALSTNIKERRDFSCAIFNRHGKMIAQAAHIPVHLGSMPLSVLAAIEKIEMSKGDMIILNDPFRGGTHLPDITLVAPVFIETETPIFFVANRAHHADVGGITPGSMPLSTHIIQEGIRIPPIKIVENDEIRGDVFDLLLSNVRTPEERCG
ncbi:MAG: hydantoinase B/oxoprolinase family protein, partial [Candidatus Poribacteria bacterium]|nr:hydantoinase B/oxoprolinase family protein [Candidatus Poribacteria bacterium]